MHLQVLRVEGIVNKLILTPLNSKEDIQVQIHHNNKEDFLV